ncbi:MAG: DUF4352 domain-containing protein, partial [Frankiaceae bacterium]|nr:DUF4352 domain-containing protein [Frankiaceae bacterium]
RNIGVNITVDAQQVSPGQALSVSAYDLSLKLDNGTFVSASPDTPSTEPILPIDDLSAAGQSKSGFVFFDVPGGSRVTQLVYEPFVNLTGVVPVAIALV